MIPIPPTTRLIPAIAPSSSVRTPVIWLAACEGVGLRLDREVVLVRPCGARGGCSPICRRCRVDPVLARHLDVDRRDVRPPCAVRELLSRCIRRRDRDDTPCRPGCRSRQSHPSPPSPRSTRKLTPGRPWMLILIDWPTGSLLAEEVRRDVGPRTATSELARRTRWVMNSPSSTWALRIARVLGRRAERRACSRSCPWRSPAPTSTARARRRRSAARRQLAIAFASVVGQRRPSALAAGGRRRSSRRRPG